MNVDSDQCREVKGLFGLHIPIPVHQEELSGQELKQRPWRNTAYPPWLAQLVFSCSPGPTWLGMLPPIPIINEENAPKDLPAGLMVEDIFPIEIFFSSQVTIAVSSWQKSKQPFPMIVGFNCQLGTAWNSWEEVLHWGIILQTRLVSELISRRFSWVLIEDPAHCQWFQSLEGAHEHSKKEESQWEQVSR